MAEKYLEKIERMKHSSVNSAEFKYRVEKLEELVEEDKIRKQRVKKKLRDIGQLKFFDKKCF